jgi:hypothetical protein
MALYIAVFVVVVAGLAFAYRTLGAPAARPAAPLDPVAGASTLDAALALLVESDPPSADAAHRARRIAADVALRITQASVDSRLAPPAESLLGAAAEDCGWAARMAETPGYAVNPGLRAAARALLDHARDCVEEARRSAANAGITPPGE